jgi:hypothetical protein
MVGHRFRLIRIILEVFAHIEVNKFFGQLVHMIMLVDLWVRQKWLLVAEAVMEYISKIILFVALYLVIIW